MARQALIFANSLPSGLHGKGLSTGMLRRILARFGTVLHDLPGKYRFRVTRLVDARPSEVRNTAHELATRARESNDLFLLFYFGHAQLGPKLDLRFMHLRKTERDRRQLTLEMLENAVREAECTKSLFIFDCCHAGAQPWSYQSRSDGQHCRMASATPASYAYVATNSLDLPIGFFTRSLIDGFASQVACVSNTNNAVTTESLFTYIDQDVRTRTNSAQNPVIYGNIRETLTVYQPRPDLIRGINDYADEKTTYRKILALVTTLGEKGTMRDISSLHSQVLRKFPHEFETLIKNKDETFEYVPVQPSVIARYVRFLRKLGIASSEGIKLTALGRKMSNNVRSSFNLLLLESIDQHFSSIGLSRGEIDTALRQILQSRSIPAKIQVLDYLSLAHPALVKEELGIILDLLGYIRAIRMSDGRAYFAW